MPEPPRRKRFQVHLSTAVVLMFVAAVWIWLNTISSKGGPYIILDNEEAAMSIVNGYEPFYYHYGWPVRFLESYSNTISPEFSFIRIFSGWALALDVTLGFIAIILVCVGCEWWIHRGVARTGA